MKIIVKNAFLIYILIFKDANKYWNKIKKKKKKKKNHATSPIKY